MPLSKAEIELIIQEGEGYRIEFKERLSGFDKEMVAFANASGGRIFLGITVDGKIKGKPVSYTADGFMEYLSGGSILPKQQS